MEEGFSTIKTSEEERLAAIRKQLEQVNLADKDPDTAFLIEFVGGLFFGALGVGYIYSGLTNTGIFRLAAYWAYAITVAVFVGFCSAVTLGFGACLAIPLLPLHLFLVYVSANDLKRSIIAAKAIKQAASGTTSPGGYLGSTPENPIPPLYGAQDQEEQKRY
ncbi:MAG: hypothetical protein H0T73_03610 [Ardenticatenales bacterium]|nr:hypothetical protein [Ardenticatenales bacterium]